MAQRKLLQLQRHHQGQEPFVYADFRFDEHGLTTVGSPTGAEWAECLDHLMHVEENVHFWIGDLLLYGESRWGEMSVQQMIEATGYDDKTFGVFKWVAAQVDISRRRVNLTFSHHQAVAGLPMEQQALILTRAEGEGWTTKTVRHEVNCLACESERPAGPPILSGLHHGDCREVMATLPDESIDLLLTDPPTGGPEALRVVDDVLRCAITKLKPNSHAYIFVPTWEMFAEIAPLVERYFDLRNALLWVKNPPEVGEGSYAGLQGVILFAHKGRRHLNGGRDGNVLYFDPVPAPRHPQEKPLALLRYLIEKSTQGKEVVLDPFMGSGSTCVAARDAGRRYVGMEIDRQWYEESQRRLAPVPGA